MNRTTRLPKLSSKLSKVYGEEVILLGPYIESSGRKLVHVCTEAGRKTCQLARVRLEVKLGRCLTAKEEVDHIDEDCTNDSYDNIQPLTRLENQRKTVRLRRPTKMVVLRCSLCKRKFKRTARDIRSKKSQGQKHFYCCRSHAVTAQHNNATSS